MSPKWVTTNLFSFLSIQSLSPDHCHTWCMEGRYWMLQSYTNSQTCAHTYTQQSLVSAGKVAWRMLISWTGFECVWPCVGQKEPWDTETQQNWHWKQTEKKMREGGMERRSVAGRGGTERNKYLISSRGCSVRIYSKKKHEKKIWKKGGRERRRRERGTDGWKDKRMDREAGFGEQES